MRAQWLERAFADLGVSEVKGALANEQILDYFRTVGHTEITSDETAWCAAFVGTCLERSGIRSTRSLMARSYAGYGTQCEPREGAIVVFPRTSNPRFGHVELVASVDVAAGTMTTIGGNVANRVSSQERRIADAIAFRWPPTDGAPVTIEHEAAHVDQKGTPTAAPHRPRHTTPQPLPQAARTSQTIWGSITAFFAGLGVYLDGLVRGAIEAVAALTEFQPAQAALLSAGANSKSLALGGLVFAVVLVISRRLSAAKEGRIG